MKIALTGPLYSGKTTLARYLEETYGWHMMDYTGLLKTFAAQALSAIPGYRELTKEDLEKEKGVFRGLLQELGSVLKFDDGFGVEYVIKEWQKAGSPEPVIFDNVRFMPQFNILQQYGFVLVGLTITNKTQQLRAKDKNVAPEVLERMLGHVAEAGVSPEILLPTDTTSTPMLANILDRLAA